MDIRKPKTLEEFPKFIVAAVRRGETSASGYTTFELDGQFDRVTMIQQVDPSWFWLLIGQNDCLCASLKLLDRETKAAILTCDEKEEPNVVGEALAYLSPYWQAFNVWMVLDPNWGWKKIRFSGVDATATDYEANDISIVDGREVKMWTKLEPAHKTGGESRHYPADDQTSPPRSETRPVPGGWDHEHCALCKNHINAGDSGYCDPAQRWMCENCYQRYVIPRDLAFVDEL
jgi:hypothetical protein